MTGQVIYHLLAAAHATRAPWPVVVLVSCLPVATLGLATGLTHLLRASDAPSETPSDAVSEPVTEAIAKPVMANAEPVSAIPAEPVIAGAAARSPQRRRHAGRSRRGGSLPQRQAARAAREAEALTILSAEPGIGTTELARRLDCSVSTAQRLRNGIRTVQPVS